MDEGYDESLGTAESLDVDPDEQASHSARAATATGMTRTIREVASMR
jgi:hypothetical protein